MVLLLLTPVVIILVLSIAVFVFFIFDEPIKYLIGPIIARKKMGDRLHLKMYDLLISGKISLVISRSHKDELFHFLRLNHPKGKRAKIESFYGEPWELIYRKHDDDFYFTSPTKGVFAIRYPLKSNSSKDLQTLERLISSEDQKDRFSTYKKFIASNK